MGHVARATGVAARLLRAFALIALLAGSATIATATPAGAATTTVDVEVAGQGGQTFPANTAGVVACAEPCETLANPIIGLADGDGAAQLTVLEDAEYRAQGFAMNTGWRDPDLVLGTVTIHLGEPLRNVDGADLDGMTFIVPRPTGPPSSLPTPTPGMVDVQLLVVDAAGAPFRAETAGVMFCLATCAGGWDLFSSADSDGVVLAKVEARQTYFVTALVKNTGWCGGWNDGGDTFWFSEEVRFAAGAAMNNPTTLTIHEPVC